MTSCFAWLVLLAGAIFVMVSLIRWFDHSTEAVDEREWNRVILLLIFPPVTWFFPGRVAAGRPTMVPRHEPVRGFGKIPLMPTDAAQQTAPPPPKKKRSAIDPEMIAKMKQKMKEQGMLDDDSSSQT